MSVEVKEILNDFDKDEVVYCVIDIDPRPSYWKRNNPNLSLFLLNLG